MVRLGNGRRLGRGRFFAWLGVAYGLGLSEGDYWGVVTSRQLRTAKDQHSRYQRHKS